MIETDRLILRQYTQEDLDGYYRLKSSPQVWTYSTFCPMENREQAKVALNKLLERQKNSEIGFMAVIEKETGVFTGEAGIISCVSSACRGEIGYNLLPEYWGRGYGTEIATAIIKEAFEKGGYERMEALVIADNKASCRVLEKAGFQREGLLRNFNRSQQGYRNVCYYGILAEDYRKTGLSKE